MYATCEVHTQHEVHTSLTLQQYIIHNMSQSVHGIRDQNSLILALTECHAINY